MRSSLSLRLLPLITLVSSSSAHLPTNHLIFGRQGYDCLAAYSPSQPDYSVPCGGINVYISNQCTCCPSGTIGCSSQHVCAPDPYGGDMCCPLDNPTCSVGSGNDGGGGTAAATTTAINDSPAAPTSSSEGNGSGQAAATTSSVAPVSSGHSVALKVEVKLVGMALVFLAML